MRAPERLRVACSRQQISRLSWGWRLTLSQFRNPVPSCSSAWGWLRFSDQRVSLGLANKPDAADELLPSAVGAERAVLGINIQVNNLKGAFLYSFVQQSERFVTI